jgi:hypothetical protein
MAYPKNRKLRRNGMFGSPEYNIHQAMIQRCYNAKNKYWYNYGERGITVCDSWIGGEGDLDGFDCFLRDMGRRPSDKHTLDRENNDLEYSPRNCRWATRQENQNNRRNTIFVEFRGQRMAIADAARLVGMPPHLPANRIRLGWTVERALTTPKKW